MAKQTSNHAYIQKYRKPVLYYNTYEAERQILTVWQFPELGFWVLHSLLYLLVIRLSAHLLLQSQSADAGWFHWSVTPSPFDWTGPGAWLLQHPSAHRLPLAAAEALAFQTSLYFQALFLISENKGLQTVVSLFKIYHLHHYINFKIFHKEQIVPSCLTLKIVQLPNFKVFEISPVYDFFNNLDMIWQLRPLLLTVLKFLSQMIVVRSQYAGTC